MKTKTIVILLLCLGLTSSLFAASIWPMQGSKNWADGIWEEDGVPGVSDTARLYGGYGLVGGGTITVAASTSVEKIRMDKDDLYPAVPTHLKVTGQLTVSEHLRIGEDTGGSKFEIAGGTAIFNGDKAADGAVTFEVTNDQTVGSTVLITAGSLTLQDNTRFQIEADSASTVTVSGTGVIEFQDGSDFDIASTNNYVTLSEGGLIKYTGRDASTEILTLAIDGRLVGTSPLATPPYTPDDGIANVGLYYDGADTYAFAVATMPVKPLVNAGDDKMIWLPEDGKVDLMGEIANYDSQYSYTYTWSDDPCAPAVTFSTPVTVVDANCPTTATFTADGEYTLTLEVTNENGSRSDKVTFTLIDPAVTNLLSAYWALDDGGGNTVADSSTDGGFDHSGTVAIANWQDGWVGCSGGSLGFDGEPNSVAAFLADPTQDPNEGNLDNIRYGITIAAWVKPNTTEFDKFILQKNGCWNLRVRADGSIRFKLNDTSNQYTDSDASTLGYASLNVDDGYWHHVAATYSAVDEEANLYVDGVLVRTRGTDGLLNTIADDPNVYMGGDYVGGIDDVQLYSYALTSLEVETLAAMGDTLLWVDAGSSQVYQISDTKPLQLTGSVMDMTSVPTNVGWTVVTGNSASVEFTNAADPATTVEFDRNDPGTFVLELSATDTLCGETVVVTDTVTIIASLPTCADVIADGLKLPLDISGAVEGEPDCRVDLYDFAYITKSWMECNDPENSECAWAWE